VAIALARSGVRHLTIIDPDRFDGTNASRQLMFGDVVGKWKALVVARYVIPHMIAGGTITALAVPFQEAVQDHVLAADILAASVDNNRCRWEAAQFGLRYRVPVVFAMLSADATRAHLFLQESAPRTACLWCALQALRHHAPRVRFRPASSLRVTRRISSTKR
jgi:molybdopterin/thiamine biosynthesis adenylyltransferase